MILHKQVAISRFFLEEVKVNEASMLLDGKRMVVSFTCNGTERVWRGKEMAKDHWSLRCVDVAGTASLHRFAESLLFVGSVKESGGNYLWKVCLNPDTYVAENIPDELT
jgi:hypothetical protein